jgi:putative IMPACT (imprinted ancient) family translation regulator
LSEPYEVEYWTKKFGVSKSELGMLVMKHGNSVKKIEEALKK